MTIEEKIDNREKNLKLHYESVRKDLDIVLTSTIPTQKNLMKTILWLNVSIIGAILVKNEELPYLICLLPSISFSSIALLLIMYSLKKGQVKFFGQADIDEIENLSGKFEHIEGLSIMMYAAKGALTHNLKITQERADKISRATTFTLFSLVLVMLYGIVIANIKLH